MTSQQNRVVAYCRVSTEEQGRSGLGLDAQRAAIEAEVERRGWTLVRVVEEVASGAKANRSGLAEALALIQRGEADGLVVSKLDRLSRSTAQFATMLDQFRAAGWSLVVLDVAVDTTSIIGEAMASMASVFAQMERRRIGERTRDALAQARERGVRLGRPPVLADELRERIVELRGEGRTYRQVADLLNAQHVPTAHGGARWHGETVRKVVLAAMDPGR